jgi:hypothetical protein
MSKPDLATLSKRQLNYALNKYTRGELFQATTKVYNDRIKNGQQSFKKPEWSHFTKIDGINKLRFAQDLDLEQKRSIKRKMKYEQKKYNIDIEKLNKKAKEAKQKFDDEKRVIDLINYLEDTPKVNVARTSKSIKGYSVSYKVSIDDNNMTDFLKYQHHIIKDPIKDIINKQLKKLTNIKVILTTVVNVHKYLADEDEFTFDKTYFSSKPMIILSPEDFNKNYGIASSHMNHLLDIFIENGSAWSVDAIQETYVNIVKYVPMRGNGYFKVPKKLSAKKGIINPINSDNRCFLYALTTAKYNIRWKDKSACKLCELHFDEFKMDGIKFPVTIEGIKRFEKLNNIGIKLFSCDIENEKFDIYPVHNQTKYEEFYRLLLLNNGDETHYCCISNLSRLVSTNHHEKTYCCDNCLCLFSSKQSFNKHQELNCINYDETKIQMPKEKSFVQFKHPHYSVRKPIYITADFESLLENYDEPDNKKSINKKSYTNKYQKHTAVSYGIRIISDVPEIKNATFTYHGLNCVEQFVEKIFKIKNEVLNFYNDPKKIIMSSEDVKNFNEADECYICHNKLNDDEHGKFYGKVRDHCHFSGKYLGAAHSDCIVNRRFSHKFLPIVIHNLKGYDGHLIIKELSRYMNVNNIGTVDCIPNNKEKYMTISTNPRDVKNDMRIKFIDSLQFMNASIEALTNSLQSDINNFHHMKTIIPNISIDDLKLLLRKGVDPYDYFDTFDKYNQPIVLSKDIFYSKMKKENISEKDYEFAQMIVKKFNLKTWKDYIDLYLRQDVLLLADIFENFRKTSLSMYGLDPLYYLTSPGLAWDAMLKKTNVKLELLTDYNMYMMYENGLRGGISLISHRYAEANNPYMKNYNKDAEIYYIIYDDANNLYAVAMIKFLPTGGFKWEDVTYDWLSNIDGLRGCTLEVDLKYPEHLHDTHKNYPLAPEKMVINTNNLSPVQIKLMEELGIKKDNTAKLILTLNDKHNYVVNDKVLSLYVSLGLQVTKIHRIISYNQSEWLKEYIDMNTNARKLAKSTFEKDFFKLMNNSVFGKTMENIRNRCNSKIVNDENKLLNYTKKCNFKNITMFDKYTYMVEMSKKNLVMDKPIYVGFNILDLSKHHMYNFHYNYIMKKYPDCKLLFTDTDSLCYHIKTDDIYQDMYNDKHLFDLSETKNVKFNNTENAKIIGKFKDETLGKPISKFVGLRSKMYCCLLDDGSSKQTGKGINKSVLKNEITFKNYYNCLFGDNKDRQQHITQRSIRSYNHEIYTIEQSKISLSAFDNKKYMLNMVESLPFGHYSLSK